MTFDPFTVAAHIADCVCPQLKHTARGDDAWSGDCCVVAGSTSAWDQCCDGAGTMWVSVVNGYPTLSFPTPQAVPHSSCAVAHQAVTFEIGVIRCVCTMDENGNPCTCDQKEADAARVLGDLTAVLTGLSCCFTDERDDCEEWVLASWRTVGPQGGCAGVVVTVTVELDNPCCAT